MGRLANTPSWGILVKAPVEEVRKVLASFGHHLVFRTTNDWTAAFYMEPVDTADDEAAERLRSRGYVPIYRFDFSKYEFLTWHWDGQRWNLLETDSLYVDPDTILGDIGLQAPYWDEPAPRSELLEVREAIVIVGVSVEQAGAIAGDRLRIEPGPLGAIVYQPDLNTRFAFWECAPERVLEVVFFPKAGEFWFRVMKGEECLGTFRPGETRTWDGTPFLASVEGETEPEAIVEKLGIPRSFVARA